MTGWKTKLGGFGMIFTGAGTFIGGLLGCLDGDITQADVTALSAGMAMMSSGFAAIGIGHKIEKSGK